MRYLIQLLRSNQGLVYFRLAISQIIRAFLEVIATGTFPATAVIPNKSISGDAKANNIAMASSFPESVSIITFMDQPSRTPAVFAVTKLASVAAMRALKPSLERFSCCSGTRLPIPPI